MLHRLLLALGLLLAGGAFALEPAPAAVSTMVPGQEVAELARQYLQRQLASSYVSVEVTPVVIPPDVAVGSGLRGLKVRELATPVLRPRMVVWVDVFGAGIASRAVPVPLAVRAMGQVLRARHAMAPGGVAVASDFEVQLRDVAQLPGAPAAPLPAGVQVRLRKGLAAGEVLLQTNRASAGGVLRGDRVRLQAGKAGMLLETAALALADGEPGQRIAVRPVAGEAAVQAMVAGDGVVRLEE